MVVNFYKLAKRDDFRNALYLTTKNIEYMPRPKDHVVYQGQLFFVVYIELDLDTCNYNIFVARL